MMRSHRHTIMDGRAVTFAMSFEADERSALNGPRYVQTAKGPFEVSASRNGVLVHIADIKNQEEMGDFLCAVTLAWEEHIFLAGCSGRPDDEDRGEPRKI